MTIHTIDLNFQGIPHAIAAYLVESEEGPILIETGPHSTFGTLRTSIEKCGYTISDIKHVFLTHIHFDHAGAAWAFAELGAKIYLHPVGAPHMVDPSRLVASAKRIYKDKMDLLWGKLNPISKNQLVLVNDKQSFNVGQIEITGHHTPGHATHHIAWQINGHIFTGDVAGVCINKGLVMAPCPPPDIHIEDWNKSIETLKSLKPELLYLAHFGKIDQPLQHLESLSKSLNDWASWMKPYANSDIDIKEVIPKFQEYVAEQLRSAGISESGIRQYETANPSWMSVAGLLRYWRKKNQV